jgi:cyclophilin family peptidyl-prolyl cis-trans isomerase
LGDSRCKIYDAKAGLKTKNERPITKDTKGGEIMIRKQIAIIFLTAWAFITTAQENYPTVVIETNYGTMKARLYDDTPVHSNHYLKLINQGYFDGTLFHRVVKNFVVQGGAQDSRNAPSGAQVGSGRTDLELNPEFLEHRYHKKGALGAPRKGDNENPGKRSDASQFYIVHGQIYTEGRLDTLERVVNVILLKLDPGGVGRGDQVTPEDKSEDRYYQGRCHVGLHKPFKTDAVREDGDDFGVVGHLRGKENYGQEDEEGAKQVGIIGDEIEVIIKDDSLQ